MFNSDDEYYDYFLKIPNGTGTIFVRDVGDKVTKLKKDEKLIILTGVIKVPKDCELKGECIYVVTGQMRKGVSQLDIHHRTEEDVSKITIGDSISGVLLKSLWRT